MENKAMNSNILSVKGSDSDSYLDSDEQEEYLYNKPIKYKYSNNTIKKKKNIEFHPELEYDKNLYYEQNAFISPDKSTKKKKKNYGSIIKDRKLSQHFQSFTDSEDETFIQIWNKNNNFKRRKRMMSDISLFSILVLISICSFFMAIYSMSTLPLVDVAIVNIKSVLAAENSLTFYIHVRGANWNLWSISVQQCTLGIYVTPKGNHTLDPQGNYY
ncbi:hypothetical protein K502DRAFT_324270 [Neoconidiobolus thromboides FSU 785]|nr:hypothetical protein K502DRAFT_324270 [Neoconidiobolus thromboides FSU 785]